MNHHSIGQLSAAILKQKISDLQKQTEKKEKDILRGHLLDLCVYLSRDFSIPDIFIVEGDIELMPVSKKTLGLNAVNYPIPDFILENQTSMGFCDFVHKLVYIKFTENPEEIHCVRHKECLFIIIPVHTSQLKNLCKTGKPFKVIPNVVLMIQEHNPESDCLFFTDFHNPRLLREVTALASNYDIIVTDKRINKCSLKGVLNLLSLNTPSTI